MSDDNDENKKRTPYERGSPSGIIRSDRHWKKAVAKLKEAQDMERARIQMELQKNEERKRNIEKTMSGQSLSQEATKSQTKMKEKQKTDRDKKRDSKTSKHELLREKKSWFRSSRDKIHSSSRDLRANRSQMMWNTGKVTEVRAAINESKSGLFNPDNISVSTLDAESFTSKEVAEFGRGLDATKVLKNLESFQQPVGEHRMPPLPESSFSRIFYKMGPLGRVRRRRNRLQDMYGDYPPGSPYYGMESLRKVCWVTRTMVDSSRDTEFKIECDMKELVIFSLYLGVLSLIAFGMLTPSMSYMTKSMRHAFISRRFESEGVDMTFMNIRKPIQIFDFMEQVFLRVVYKEFWYSRGTKEIEVSDEDVGLLFENKILGMPVIQMMRAGKNTCSIHYLFSPLYSTCFSYYTEETQDKSDFVGFEEVVWKWQPGHDEVKYRGIIGNYEPGGYYQSLQDNREDFFIQLHTLKNNLWISRGTRIVIVNVNVYNANVNLFCAIRLAFEIPPTGGVVPSYKFNTVKLTRYLTVRDYFVMGCEMVFCLFTILYLFQLIREMMYVGTALFVKFWSIIDMAIVVLSFVLAVMIILRGFIMAPKIYSMLVQEFYTLNIQSMAFEQNAFNNLLAVTLFLLWIKFFRFINFNRSMTIFATTISNCSGELFSFAIIFLIVFYAYVILSYVWFGKQLYEYSTLRKTSMTLLRLMLGDLSYARLSNVDPVLAALFFISFIFIVLYILLNMFISILCHSYGEVKNEGFYNPTNVTPLRYFKRFFYNAFRVSEKSKIKMTHRFHAGKHSVTFREIVDVLEKYNFTKEEIEMFLSKYKIRDFRFTHREDVEKIVKDIESRGFVPDGPYDTGDAVGTFAESAQARVDGRIGDEGVIREVTFLDYETLQARLDQIEIQFELMAERLSIINKRTLS